MANQHRKKEGTSVEIAKKPPRRLFADCGRPYSLNEPKVEFRFEDLQDKYLLDVHVHK